MDIYDFDYNSKHFKNRVYEVHPLSNEGFNQYISGDSYTHKYMDPNVHKPSDAQILRDPNYKEFSSTCDKFSKRNFPPPPKEEIDEKILYNMHILFLSMNHICCV